MGQFFDVELVPSEIYEEILKVLISCIGLYLVGWLAHKNQWIGVQKWDATKYAYEIFSAEQRRRLDLLAEMHEIGLDVSERLRALRYAKAHLKQYAEGKKQLSQRLRDEAQTTVSLQEKAIVAAQNEMVKLSRRYGAIPPMKGNESEPLSNIVKQWASGFEHMTQDATILDAGRDIKIDNYGAQMISTVAALRNEEERLLFETKPQDVTDLLRARHHIGSNTLLRKPGD